MDFSVDVHVPIGAVLTPGVLSFNS
jgi:hypothetical protein